MLLILCEFSFEIIVLFFFSICDSEKGDVKSKTEALKKVIIMILNGEKLPGLLMTIIRFVLPLQDHTIKKLLLVFWEIVPKTTPDGRLLHEMILVCDAYRKVNQILILSEYCFEFRSKIGRMDFVLIVKIESLIRCKL